MQQVKSNIEDVIKNLLEHKERVLTDGRFVDALVASLNVGMGLMKRRIFNLAQDVNGNTLGIYKSASYIKKRLKAGRQVEQKDLEFLGSLRRSIEVIIKDDRVVTISFVNAENAKIAGYQETQLETEIFSLSLAEFEQVETQALRLYEQILSEL